MCFIGLVANSTNAKEKVEKLLHVLHLTPRINKRFYKNNLSPVEFSKCILFLPLKHFP